MICLTIVYVLSYNECTIYTENFVFCIRENDRIKEKSSGGDVGGNK